jgi:cytochrome o ubiquinol oxidase operon protein cyoD
MQHGNHAHHDAAHADEIHFTLKGYLAGFGVAAALTAIPFWLVMTHAIANAAVAAAVVVALAVAQILVHTFAFLHVNARAQDGWTLVAYVFTGVLVLIVIGGSLWIMDHLNLNMMPGMMGGGPDSGM